MANRVTGRILIIDSAMGNTLALNSAGILPIHLDTFNVNAIAVWSADSTGAILLTGANTSTDIFFKHDFPTGTQNQIANPKWFSFGQAQSFQGIKAPTVTAGTVMLYFV